MTGPAHEWRGQSYGDGEGDWRCRCGAVCDHDVPCGRHPAHPAPAVPSGDTAGTAAQTGPATDDEATFPAHWIESLCEVMHHAYEAEALRVGWNTNPLSVGPWEAVPATNKAAMRAGVRAMLAALFRGDKPWPGRSVRS